MHKYLLFFFAITVILLSCNSSKNLIENQPNEHRKQYLKDLSNPDHGPIKSSQIKYISFYDWDEAYNCNCEYELSSSKDTLDFHTFSGIIKQYRVHGIATCIVKNEKINLTLYESIKHMHHPIYGAFLFLPFKDVTNGETTYGGGRYIDIRKTDIIDGKVAIDFNKCYNPYCAYSDGYNCPIPPIANHLAVKIEAGEKDFSDPNFKH
jgi:uncharacterized protein (DUF1684 family)